MEKSKLDQLRIERGPEKAASRWPWIVLIVVLLVGAGWFGFGALNKDDLLEVRTARVTELRGSQASTVLNASGYVTARRQATVSSKFTGRVLEVLIEEGMRVEAGQVLARLDSANIDATLNLSRAQLHSSQTAQQETQALLDEAQANLRRTEQLIERKLASESELDRAKAAHGALSARLALRQADVEVARKQLDVYLQQREDTVIRAPFEGVIVAKNAQPGEMISPVSAGGGFTRTGIGTIVDMGSLEIEIDVNEAYINRVQAGQAVVATLDAYPQWRIPSHVIAIIPTADRQKATVEVRVGFDQLDPRILPDMGVKVAFQEQGSEEPGERGILVPLAAVRNDGGQDHVFLVANGRLERRAVTLGSSRNNGVMIKAGLSGGESVVVSATPGLADGLAVREAGNE